MDLRDLERLVAVVEEGSFTAAASARHLSQPLLSTTVQRLEAELGVTLLRRHARGVSPTEAGGFLVHEARRVLAEIADLRPALQAIAAGRTGHINVATVPYSSWVVMPRILQIFAEHAPDVTVSVHDVPPDDVITRVRSGESGAGVVFTGSTEALGHTAAAGLGTAVISRERLALVTPDDHPAAALDTVRLADLRRLRADRWIEPVSRSSFVGMIDVAISAWSRAGFSLQEHRSRATIAAVQSLVASGHGIALLPESVAHAAAPGISVRPLELDGVLLEVALVWQPDGSSAVVQAFVKAARASFPDLRPPAPPTGTPPSRGPQKS